MEEIILIQSRLALKRSRHKNLDLFICMTVKFQLKYLGVMYCTVLSFFSPFLSFCIKRLEKKKSILMKCPISVCLEITMITVILGLSSLFGSWPSRVYVN